MSPIEAGDTDRIWITLRSGENKQSWCHKTRYPIIRNNPPPEALITHQTPGPGFDVNSIIDESYQIHLIFNCIVIDCNFVAGIKISLNWFNKPTLPGAGHHHMSRASWWWHLRASGDVSNEARSWGIMTAWEPGVSLHTVLDTMAWVDRIWWWFNFSNIYSTMLLVV